jgi:hypothetical protein
MFTLYEEFLLLCIHEDKGTLIRSTVERMKPGVIGAILAELAMLGKIKVSNTQRLQLTDDSQTDDGVLNQVLNTLKESEKDRKFGYWINNLSQKPEKLRKQIIENLLQKGVIAQEDDNLFWVIPSPLQSEKKASTKYWINNRLRGIVIAQEEIQPRDLALLSLVRASGLLDLVFLRDERKLASRFINELVVNQSIKDPIIETIQGIETAIAALVEED